MKENILNLQSSVYTENKGCLNYTPYSVTKQPYVCCSLCFRPEPIFSLKQTRKISDISQIRSSKQNQPSLEVIQILHSDFPDEIFSCFTEKAKKDKDLLHIAEVQFLLNYLSHHLSSFLYSFFPHFVPVMQIQQQHVSWQPMVTEEVV